MNSSQLKKRRKYAIVIAFVVAAILTPPDLISQIGLGIPIIILFEISIYLAVIFENRKTKKKVKILKKRRCLVKRILMSSRNAQY